MHTRLAAAPLLGLSVLLAACSSGASPTAAPATPAPASAAPATEAPTLVPTEAPPTAGASVMVAESSLGSILTDDKGMTLYVFLPDNAGDSTCYEGCAAAWPPLLSDAAPSVGTGLDAAAFGSTDRTDGGKQVTFYGWPLYYFASDAAAGDTNGQGLNDVWFVVGPDGTAIGAPAAGAAVNVATTGLGDVLVDGAGLTLYMFTADADGKSACYGDCATSWPPLIADAAPSLGKGLDAEAFGSITRDDGKAQVTFDGMPLYFFAGDTAPGDVNGQGLGGKWYVLGADGTVLKSGEPKGY